MKETKFRLIKDNKIVGYEEHRRLNDGMGHFSIHIYHSRTGHPMSWREITQCPGEYLAHDDKDQLTGLKDKNKKEIYEGDLIQNESGRICEVSWCDSFGCWDSKVLKCVKNDNADNFKPQYWFCVEIIGNIHENPELIKESQ